MQETASEDRLPAPGNPRDCIPAGSGCCGQLLWTWTRTSGQHLDGRFAQQRRLESLQWWKKSGSGDKACQGYYCNTIHFLSRHHTGKFMSSVTEFGCIPVSTVYHADQYGYVVIRLVYINTVRITLEPVSQTFGNRKYLEEKKVINMSLSFYSLATSTTSLGSQTPISSTLQISASLQTV